MQQISFITAQARGFNPRTYSPHPPFGQHTARVDFLGLLGAQDVALFFRMELENERFYAPLDKALSLDNKMPDKSANLPPYLQQNDQCAITIYPNQFGRYCVRDVILLMQVPLCSWSEQCDKLSPCCVFRS